MLYNSVSLKCSSEIIFNFNFNFKNRPSNGQSNAVTLVGTLVLLQNRILSSLDRLDVFLRSIKPPNHPIGIVIWPQIIVLAWIYSSEIQILDRMRRKKHSFQLGF